MFFSLSKYKNIAWDVDETLVNHESQELFWDFIKKNPFCQNHHIITMRSHGHQDMIFDDMYHNLSPSYFKSISNIPDEIYENYYDYGHDEHPYVKWKAEVCVKMGIPVLIDDLGNRTLPKYPFHDKSIAIIHPDELIY